MIELECTGVARLVLLYHHPPSDRIPSAFRQQCPEIFSRHNTYTGMVDYKCLQPTVKGALSDLLKNQLKSILTVAMLTRNGVPYAALNLGLFKKKFRRKYPLIGLSYS